MARGQWGELGLTAAQVGGLMGCSERTAKRYLYQYCLEVRQGVRAKMTMDDLGTLIEQYRYVAAQKRLYAQARKKVEVPKPPSMRTLGYWRD